jgi:hypothetical protein
LPQFLIWVMAIAATALVLDRLFLWMEARNWIYYRRSKGGPRGAVYHALETHSIFDPGIEHVREIQVKEEEEEDESGDPPVDDGQLDGPEIRAGDDSGDTGAIGRTDKDPF